METAITSQKIRHLPLTPPLCISAGTSLSDAVLRMQKERKSCILICKEDRCIGIFTERDYLQKIVGKELGSSRSIDDFMSTDPKTLTLENTVGEAIRLLHDTGYRNVPLVDGEGRCAGLLQIRSIIDFLAELYPEEVLNAGRRNQKFSEPDGA
jgi:CBS domain-containing protein